MNARKITVLDVVSRFVLFILVLFFISVAIRVFTRIIVVEKLGMNNKFTDLVFFDAPALTRPDLANTKEVKLDIDWEKEFPFDDQTAANKPQSNNSSIIQRVLKIDSLIKVIERRIISYTTDKVVLYSRFSEMANLYKQTINWDLASWNEYNGVITMDDGFLTTFVEKSDVSENVAAISDLKMFLDQRDVGLLYVQIPHKICQGDINLSGVIDFSNQNADEFLSGIKTQNIDFIDLRDVLHQEALNHHELFYRTDHHWKAETGLWAAGTISKHLNDRYGFNIDMEIMNPKNYDYVVYKDWFFGSQGKKVTLSKAQPEDISLIYPKFDVDLLFQIPEQKVNLDGDFNVIYDYSHVEEIDYYNMDPYAAYMYGNNAYSTFQNNLVPEGKKVLVIGDSNDNSMVPFLALGIKNVDSLDLRHFDGSLLNLIEKNGYDLVIIDYIPGAINSINFSLHNGFFDFR